MHPYRTAPATAFWSRSVSEHFDAKALLVGDNQPLIRKKDRVATAGSCFASNLVPYLEENGLTYLRKTVRHPALLEIPRENLGYDKFSAGYGNIYTVRQLLQLLLRSTGKFKPAEDRWITAQGVIDPFRPGLRYHALTMREFDSLTSQHLKAVRQVFEQADVFIFTLGLTEAWVSKIDGAVFPACPGTVAGAFDAAKHQFVNFSVDEIDRDLGSFLSEFHALNPKGRVVLTVSPVPLVATATANHVLCASTYSKSVLRVVAEQVAIRNSSFVRYFPAYEIITGPQAPGSFFEPDRRNVSPEGVKTVMSAFLAHCELSNTSSSSSGATDATDSDLKATKARAELSNRLADAECEEAMADDPDPKQG